MIHYKDAYKLPLNIELLFNNIWLDTMSLLCVLSCFKRRKKGVSIDELAFYYSIVTSEIEIIFEVNNMIIDNSRAKFDVDMRYFKTKDRVRNMIGILSGINCVDLILTNKFNRLDLNIQINSEGLGKVNSIESHYYIDLINSTLKLMKILDFNVSNLKRILGVIV